MRATRRSWRRSLAVVPLAALAALGGRALGAGAEGRAGAGEPPRQRAAALAAEAGHAVDDIGREAGARLLPVVADVDAYRELAGYHLAHGRRRLAGQRLRLHPLAVVLAHEQVAERRRTRDAADVGGEDAIVTLAHAPSGDAPRVYSAPS